MNVYTRQGSCLDTVIFDKTMLLATLSATNGYMVVVTASMLTMFSDMVHHLNYGEIDRSIERYKQVSKPLTADSVYGWAYDESDGYTYKYVIDNYKVCPEEYGAVNGLGCMEGHTRQKGSSTILPPSACPYLKKYLERHAAWHKREDLREKAVEDYRKSQLQLQRHPKDHPFRRSLLYRR